jgi:hypothetical protein
LKKGWLLPLLFLVVAIVFVVVAIVVVVDDYELVS